MKNNEFGPELLNEMQIYKLKQHNWSYISKSAKIDLLEDIANQFCEFYNINKNINIYFMLFPPLGGDALAFSKLDEGKIFLNDNYFNHKYKYYGLFKKKKRYEYTAMDVYHTLMHELRHIYQYWTITSNEAKKDDYYELINNNIYSDKYRDNYLPINYQYLYCYQFIERDAINYEFKQIDKYISILQNNNDIKEMNALIEEKKHLINYLNTVYEELKIQLSSNNPIEELDAFMKKIRLTPFTTEDIYPNDTETNKALNNIYNNIILKNYPK